MKKAGWTVLIDQRGKESHSPKYSTRQPKGAGSWNACWNARRNQESQSGLEQLMAPGSGPEVWGKAGERSGAEDSGNNWRSVSRTALAGTAICFPHSHIDHRQPSINPQLKNQIPEGTNNRGKPRPLGLPQVEGSSETGPPGPERRLTPEQAGQPTHSTYTEGTVSHPVRWKVWGKRPTSKIAE